MPLFYHNVTVDRLSEKLHWNIVWNTMYTLYMCSLKVTTLPMEKFGWGDLFISKHTCCKCFNNAEKRFCASVSVSFFISSHTWYTSVGLSKIQSHVFYVWFLYDKILDDLPVAQAFRVSNVKVHLSCNPICTRVCHFLKFNFWYKWIEFIYPVFFLILCLSH